MASFDKLKKIALSFPETTEAPHFEKISFRVKNKIFVTYEKENKRACIRLSENEQYLFCAADKENIYPVANKWGKKGWTLIETENVQEALFLDALRTAYCEVAPKKLADQVRNLDDLL